MKVSGEMQLAAKHAMEHGEEGVARALQAWYDTGAFHLKNEMYYRGLLDEIGAALGEAAHICDDGSRSDGILRAKLPELVRELTQSHAVAAS